MWPSYSKWLSEQSNESASNFPLSLTIPPQTLFRWFRSLSGTMQCKTMHPLMHHILCRVFWWNIQLHRWLRFETIHSDLTPYDFRLFPKLKSPVKGKRFQTISEIQENIMEQLMVFYRVFWTVEETLGELSEVPRCLLWRGLGHHCPMYNVSCIFIFFNKCSYFSFYMSGYFLDRPHIDLIIFSLCPRSLEFLGEKGKWELLKNILKVPSYTYWIWEFYPPTEIQDI